MDQKWDIYKCGFKLIQYMAVGLPAVASPVGVNADIVQQGENGFWPRRRRNGKNTWEDLCRMPSFASGSGRPRRRIEEATPSRCIFLA